MVITIRGLVSAIIRCHQILPPTGHQWRHLSNEPGLDKRGQSQSDHLGPVQAADPHFLGQQILLFVFDFI